MTVKMKMFALVTVWGFAAVGFSDTFKNKATGEVFHGFMTQKSSGSKTLVYNSEEKKLTTINIDEYEVAYDGQGRKNNVVVVPITLSEILLSQSVAETIAQAIIESSNKGPQAIIVQIDNPGGRADYMKIITSAILETKNCPVVAYITGSGYGGAFSTAAMIALACRKVYIASTASIGAVAPFAGPAPTAEDYAGYLSVYCPYAADHKTIAEYRNRPKLLTEALINRKISVVEVTNPEGARDFIQKDQRQPTQTIVRTLAEGVSDSGDSSISPAEVEKASLHLTAAAAVEVGLADKAVDSLSDVLTEMNIPTAQLTNASGIESVIKKYQAARRKISESLARIQRLEDRAYSLEEQFTDIEKQLRTGTVTRQVQRPGRDSFRRDSRLPRDYARYYYDPTTVTPGGIVVRNRSSNRIRRETEIVTTQEPAASVSEVQRELLAALNDLISEYQRVITLAKRWPGGLPPEIPLESLEKSRTSAIALRDYLLEQPVYEEQEEEILPENTRTRRRY